MKHMVDQLNFKLKAIIAKVIENEKKFLAECVKQCEVCTLMTFHSTTGWQQKVFLEYWKTYPAMGDRLLAIGRGLHNTYLANKELYWESGRMGNSGLDVETHLELIKYLYLRYWKRIEKKHDKWVDIPKLARKMSHNTLTQDMQELLARGFIHYEDTDQSLPEEPFWIIIHESTKLTWPKRLSSLKYAEQILERFGVVGCTIKKQ